MEPNDSVGICGRSFIKFVHFISCGQQIWPPWAILNSDLPNFQKSSPLKQLGQIKPNYTGSIYGRSFIKFDHFVPIGKQTWPPWAILNSDWPNFKKSSPLKPLCQIKPNYTRSIYGRSFTKFVHFVSIGQQTWLPWAILNSDWLSFQKSSPLKTVGQVEPNYAGSIYGRSFTNFHHLVSIELQIWLPSAILVSDTANIKNSSPLKLLSQIKPYLKESICWKVFAKYPHFILIEQYLWPSQSPKSSSC